MVRRWGTNLFRTVVSTDLARGYPRLLVVVVCAICAGWAAARCYIPLRLWVWLAGVSLFSLSFLPLSFGFISLDCFSQLGPGGLGGNTARGGLSRVGFGSQCCGGSPLFPVLSFVTVGCWVIGRPRNGSRGGLLELPLYRLLEFLILALPTVHSAQ